ncbi:MAG TPA: helix-turn-helix domain-containing protein [Candidatus Acidoferrum sp.]|nr:helix-turn-helix domain-containing protein [Candidatus Acidoferrum sp.]
MSAQVKGGTRPYRTALRAEQAQLTRSRIMEAARRLLIQRGYTQVTMQQVAREAGVAYQTVFSQFRSKLQLALELCSSELLHAGEAVAMLAQARDAGDPEACLHLLGAFSRRLYEPCAEVLRFMRESGDPDLISRLREIGARRLQLLSDLGPQLEHSGRLRPGLSGRQAIDLAWAMAGPEVYEELVLDRGWTPQQFESWLGAAVADLILVA